MVRIDPLKRGRMWPVIHALGFALLVASVLCVVGALCLAIWADHNVLRGPLQAMAIAWGLGELSKRCIQAYFQVSPGEYGTKEILKALNARQWKKMQEIRSSMWSEKGIPELFFYPIKWFWPSGKLVKNELAQMINKGWLNESTLEDGAPGYCLTIRGSDERQLYFP